MAQYYTGSAEQVHMPRSFRILEEAEKGEKGNNDGSVTWGLATDTTSQSINEDLVWHCTIIGPPKTTCESRIFELCVRCGKEYPHKPPSATFKTKINMKEVRGDGAVEMGLLSVKEWKEHHTVCSILQELRKRMSHKDNSKLPQPPENSVYNLS